MVLQRQYNPRQWNNAMTDCISLMQPVWFLNHTIYKPEQHCGTPRNLLLTSAGPFLWHFSFCSCHSLDSLLHENMSPTTCQNISEWHKWRGLNNGPGTAQGGRKKGLCCQLSEKLPAPRPHVLTSLTNLPPSNKLSLGRMEKQRSRLYEGRARLTYFILAFRGNHLAGIKRAFLLSFPCNTAVLQHVTLINPHYSNRFPLSSGSVQVQVSLFDKEM